VAIEKGVPIKDEKEVELSKTPFDHAGDNAYADHLRGQIDGEDVVTKPAKFGMRRLTDSKFDGVFAKPTDTLSMEGNGFYKKFVEAAAKAGTITVADPSTGNRKDKVDTLRTDVDALLEREEIVAEYRAAAKKVAEKAVEDVGAEGIKIMIKEYYPKSILVADLKKEVALCKYVTHQMITKGKEITVLKAKCADIGITHEGDQDLTIPAYSDSPGEITKRQPLYKAWDTAFEEQLVTVGLMEAKDDKKDFVDNPFVKINELIEAKVAGIEGEGLKAARKDAVKTLVDDWAKKADLILLTAQLRR